MKHIILYFPILFSQLCFSQVTLDWKKTYHHISALDTATEAISMDINRTGNVYVTGYSNNINSHSEVITIMYDSSGSQVWMNEYDGNTNLFSAIPTKVLSDESGNCFVCGRQWFDSIGWSDFFLLKYDLFGNLIWNTVCGSFGNNVEDVPMDMQLGDSGRIYLTGYMRSNNDVNGYETISFDSAGNILWVAVDTVNMNMTFNYCYSLSLDDSENVFITGRKHYNDTSWAALLKYNKQGVKIWERDFYGDPSFVAAEPLKVLSKYQHIYVLTSNLDTTTTWGGYVISKFDTYGNLIWSSAYRGDSTVNEYPSPKDFVVDNTENIFVTGGQYFGSCTIDKCVVVKFDSNGTIIWSRDYSSNDCNWDLGRSIAVDSSGNVYTTGESGGGNYGAAEIQFCLSYDSAGNERWVDRIIDSAVTNFSRGYKIVPDNNGSIYAFGSGVDTSGFEFITLKYRESFNSISENGFPNSVFILSPNPFTANITFRFPKSKKENALLKIFSSLGEVVLEKQILLEDQTLNLSALPQGIYLVSIRSGELSWTKMIVK